MKAFYLYSNEEFYLRQLLVKLQDYGKITCNFETFSNLYAEWHKRTFPGAPIDASIAVSSNDWFLDFLKYLSTIEV